MPTLARRGTSVESASIRGKVAVVGVGQTTYYKHGKSPEPEFKLALRAILNACSDAGIEATDIDGFASYANDRNDPSRLAAALGVKELRFSNMQWGGGGGGGSGAVANAAAAICAGIADTVVVYRALNQGEYGRFGRGPQLTSIAGDMAFCVPYGIMSPAQIFAMKAMRFMYENGVEQSALRAISLASYHHAQKNPNAVMHGRPLDVETYDNSRWIAEPFHLYDCCMENDGAAALILTSADRARDLRNSPAYVLGAALGSDFGTGNDTSIPFRKRDYASANFKSVSRQLYSMAQLGPSDIDVLQSYENFTGGVLMSLVEHGFFDASDANEFLTLDNLRADSGKLPLNTSGGNLAECYMHGLELIIEAVRQVRGESYNQVNDVNVSMVISGPMVSPVSNSIYGTKATL